MSKYSTGLASKPCLRSLSQAVRELVDMKELRHEMQARRQKALNNLDNLQNVEEAFKELSGKHELEE